MRHETTDVEASAADLDEQNREQLENGADPESVVHDTGSGAAGIEADPADVHDQSLVVDADDEREQD